MGDSGWIVAWRSCDLHKLYALTTLALFQLALQFSLHSPGDLGYMWIPPKLDSDDKSDLGLALDYCELLACVQCLTFLGGGLDLLLFPGPHFLAAGGGVLQIWNLPDFVPSLLRDSR